MSDQTGAEASSRPQQDGGAGAPVPPSVHPIRINARLRLETILLRQFDFAQKMALQARQDSGQMIYFYLIAMGALVGSIGFVLQLAAQRELNLQIGMLPVLLAAGVLHDATFIRFIRLRERYIECIVRMNQITDIYISRFGHDVPQVGQLLSWTPRSKNLFTTTPFVPSSHALFPLLGGVSFVGVVIVASEIWFGMNDGALLPLPGLWSVYALGAAVFVVSLVISAIPGLVSRRTRQA